MTEFLLAALSFPAVVFTTLLGIALGYWGLVVVGAMGAEALDGAVNGILDGAAEGTLALTATEDDEPETSTALVPARKGWLARQELMRVPATVSFSLIAFFGWIITHVTTLFAGAGLDAIVPRALWGTGLFIAAIFGAVKLTSWAIIPLAPFFSDRQSLPDTDLIGKIAKVRTTRVTAKVGQASVQTTGGSLVVDIRADAELGLTKDDRVMIVAYDAKDRVFDVSRIDDMIPSAVSDD